MAPALADGGQPPVSESEMLATLRRLLLGTVWTGAEIARRRVVLAAIIERLQQHPP